MNHLIVVVVNQLRCHLGRHKGNTTMYPEVSKSGDRQTNFIATAFLPSSCHIFRCPYRTRDLIRFNQIGVNLRTKKKGTHTHTYTKGTLDGTHPLTHTNTLCNKTG